MTLHPINPLYKNTPARADPITNISKSILNFRLELFSNTTNLGVDTIEGLVETKKKIGNRSHTHALDVPLEQQIRLGSISHPRIA
jgi:hypothetical protein